MLAFQAAFGLPSLALRFFSVYGPLQAAGHAYAAVIPSFLDAALRGELLVIYGTASRFVTLHSWVRSSPYSPTPCWAE